MLTLFNKLNNVSKAFVEQIIHRHHASLMGDKRSAQIGGRVPESLRERLNAINERYGVTDTTMLVDTLTALCDLVEAEAKYTRPLVMMHAAPELKFRVAEKSQQAPPGKSRKAKPRQANPA